MFFKSRHYPSCQNCYPSSQDFIIKYGNYLNVDLTYKLMYSVKTVSRNLSFLLFSLFGFCIVADFLWFLLHKKVQRRITCLYFTFKLLQLFTSGSRNFFSSYFVIFIWNLYCVSIYLLTRNQSKVFTSTVPFIGLRLVENHLECFPKYALKMATDLNLWRGKIYWR